MNKITAVNNSNTSLENNNTSFNSKKKKIEKLLSSNFNKKITEKNHGEIKQYSKPASIKNNHKKIKSNLINSSKISACFAGIKNKLFCSNRKNNLYYDDKSVKNTNNEQEYSKVAEPIYYELEPPETTNQTPLYDDQYKTYDYKNRQLSDEHIYYEIDLN